MCGLSDDETQETVATAGPGALAGELAMIAGLAYPANITATAEVTAMRISRDVFMRVAGEFPEFGVRVHQALARRLAASMSEFDRVRSMFESARGFFRPG